MIRSFAALGAFFVVAVLVAGCGSGIPSNSVASVAGNPITLQAFNHWMYVAEKGNAEEEAQQGQSEPIIVPNDPPQFTTCIKQVREQIASLAKTSDKALRSDCQELFTSLSSQVMNFLIEAYWYQADAYKDGVKVTQAQIDSTLNSEMKQEFGSTNKSSKEYTQFLAESGQTAADIEFRARVNKVYSLLINRLQKKITPAAEAAYYKAHTSEFGTPETRNLRIVRTNSKSQVEAALHALQAGGSWATVAKKYSVDASTKNNGGLLTGVTSGEEEAALNKVAFAAPLNKLEGPVHGTFGWYIVEVVKITPGTQQPLAKSTALIKELLTSQYQTKAENSINAVSKKNWGAQTLCRQYYSMDDCHGYVAPKTTTTSATPTPTTAQTVTGSSGSSATGTTTFKTVQSPTSTTPKKKK